LWTFNLLDSFIFGLFIEKWWRAYHTLQLHCCDVTVQVENLIITKYDVLHVKTKLILYQEMVYLPHLLVTMVTYMAYLLSSKKAVKSVCVDNHWWRQKARFRIFKGFEIIKLIYYMSYPPHSTKWASPFRWKPISRVYHALFLVAPFLSHSYQTFARIAICIHFQYERTIEFILKKKNYVI
jgi:hypothetical protein